MNGRLSLLRPELHPIPVKAPWYHLGIDFVGPISPTSPSGKRYILTISDYYTKWAEAIATPDKSAPETALALFTVKKSYCISLCITFNKIIIIGVYENGIAACNHNRPGERVQQSTQQGVDDTAQH